MASPLFGIMMRPLGRVRAAQSAVNEQELGGHAFILASSRAVGAGGEFAPHKVDGEGEHGEYKQKVDFSVRHVAKKDSYEPEDGQHGRE
jgi:hypothetical protein